MRAFKHAIFGTPQTTQSKPRRNSSTDNARPRTADPRPSRPGITRPKSASDAQTLARPDVPAYAEALPSPLASPTKSILVREGGTPGGKKKNVTFGDHVVDNEEKRPLKSGLPDDCPGKFPSPGRGLGEEVDLEEDKAEKGRGRNKLTEALEQARDESRKRKKGEKKGRRDMEEEGEVPAEFREPKSEVGKYWKHEYDIYRTNTQREVKKLITKQKAAKSFALTKDIQCTELADQLRQEQRKVEELGTQMAEFAAKMRDMEEKLAASQESEEQQREELDALKLSLGRRDSARPTSSEGGPKPDSRLNSLSGTRETEQGKYTRPELPRRITREAPKPEADPVQRPSEPTIYKPSAETEKPKLDIQTLRARLKAKQEPQNPFPKSAEDIWAQSFNSSSMVHTRPVEKTRPSSKDGRAVTSGTDATPLKTLDINSLPLAKDSRRNSSLGSMEVECKSNPDLDHVDREPSVSAAEKPRRDSPLQSPSLPLPSNSELHSATSTAVKQEPVPRKAPEENSLSLPVPSSSPFQVHAKFLPSRPALSGPAGPREAKPITTNAKENVSPTSKPQPPPHAEPREKPSVLWSSINAPQVSNASAGSTMLTAAKRNTSLTAKDGREVSADRLEAARARVNARGRVTT